MVYTGSAIALLWFGACGSVHHHILAAYVNHPQAAWVVQSGLAVMARVNTWTANYYICRIDGSQQFLFSSTEVVTIRQEPEGHFQKCAANTAEHPFISNLTASVSHGWFRLHVQDKVLRHRAPVLRGFAYNRCAWMRDGSGVYLWNTRLPEPHTAHGLISFE